MAAANRRIPDMRAVVSCGRIALSRKHGAVNHHSSHGRRQHAPRRRSWLASARTDPLSRRVLASCNATISCPRATVWKISPGPSNARGPLEARSPCAPGSEHSRSRRPVSRISRRCIAPQFTLADGRAGSIDVAYLEDHGPADETADVSSAPRRRHGDVQDRRRSSPGHGRPAPKRAAVSQRRRESERSCLPVSAGHDADVRERGVLPLLRKAARGADRQAIHRVDPGGRAAGRAETCRSDSQRWRAPDRRAQRRPA